MLATLGWTLQILALLLVGAALPFGLVTGRIRTEVLLLGIGGLSFLLGRWLSSKSAR